MGISTEFGQNINGEWFGYADYAGNRGKGYSAQEILNHLDNNMGQLQQWNRPGAPQMDGYGGLYDIIRRDADAERGSSGGGGGGGGGDSTSTTTVDLDATVDNSVNGTIGDDNTFGDDYQFANNNSVTNINQGFDVQDFLANRLAGLGFRANADVNNRTTSSVGDRNTFGDGARIGNNYAVTDINQGGDYGLNLRRRSRDRRDFLEVKDPRERMKRD